LKSFEGIFASAILSKLSSQIFAPSKGKYIYCVLSYSLYITSLLKPKSPIPPRRDFCLFAKNRTFRRKVIPSFSLKSPLNATRIISLILFPVTPNERTESGKVPPKYCLENIFWKGQRARDRWGTGRLWVPSIQSSLSYSWK